MTAPATERAAAPDEHVLRDLLARIEPLVDHTRLAVVGEFVKASLRRVPREQLAAADPDALAAQVVESFRFADDRSPGELAVRAFNPEVALDGWSDPGTVVEVSVDDRPFLLSTLHEAVRRRGLRIVRTVHPILGTERVEGRLTGVRPARTADHREAFIHLELDERVPPDELGDLTADLRRVLEDVLAATRDFERMRERLVEAARHVRAAGATRYPPEDVEEAAALLDWLLADNFVLLGSCEYDVIDAGGRPALEVRHGSGLGILSDTSRSTYAQAVPIDELKPELRERVESGQPVRISRSDRISTVHRHVRLLDIWVKRLAPDGTVAGETRVTGLFARKAHAEPAADTPVLRLKLQRILELEDIVRGSYEEGTLVALFQALPKDELFETELAELRRSLIDLLAATEQRDVRLLVRPDEISRTVSAVLAIPRDRYSAALRERLQDLLLRRFGGSSVEVDLSLSDRPEAVVRFVIHVGAEVPDVPTAELEREVAQLCRSWDDDLEAVLMRRHGDVRGRQLARAYGRRLPPAYRDTTPAVRAAHDVVELERVEATGQLAIFLHPDPTPGSSLTRLKVAKPGARIELSRFLTILESLGLTVVEELPHVLEADGPELRIHDYGVRDERGPIEVERDGPRLAAAASAAWEGLLEVDGLNRLVLLGGLVWEDVAVLRAYRRYRRQVGTAYTAEYVNDVLSEHAGVAAALIDLFTAKFDPEWEAGEEDVEVSRARVLEACDAVERLDHDRILRSFLALMDATVRTNRYVGGGDRPLALKLDPSLVPQIPLPVPHREIFVYSPALEGVHLRGGPVARGGIRWSDRRDDLRTEILGLMKAQMQKNSVIVPTGAKGGFVVKRLPGDPLAMVDEVRQQYAAFIRSLLELTDNVVGGEVVPPARVVRRDGDDPYLVVAADRGTATFSDLANGIAEEVGFWLGDAFASGGSRGYDHKELGITARGTWIAVQRHFRELGIDVQTEPTTVVGIGDMSGDVFGNAMLRSRATRLVAAFDHRDIFIDPDPDPHRSFAERERLFAARTSSWQDYDRSLISTGGGVWSRHVKRIPLSPEARLALRTDAEWLTTPELVRAILAAPVDLFFAGGIGTFVKASYETHEEIGDKANDELRVDATDLRARVVGEGANLCCTQNARIQYARRGGRINTDAVDNSAGVNISDHEVNLKILLGLAIERGELTRDERDALLTAVAPHVAAACLRDVELQALLLTQKTVVSPSRLDAYEELMVHLEVKGLIDRLVDCLPTSDELERRSAAGAGLTRPELAVLLAAAKRDLSAEILDSTLPDQPALREALVSYFPPPLVERLGELIDEHRLRRELIATVVANDVVNRLGATYAHRLAGETGSPRADIIAAYWAARTVTGADRYWREVEAFGPSIDPAVQIEVKGEVDALVETLSRDYLRAGDHANVASTVGRDRPAFVELERMLPDGGTASQRARRREEAERMSEAGIDPALAVQLASLGELQAATDVAAVARAVGRPVAGVGEAFLHVGERLGLDRVPQVLERIGADDHWARWQLRGLGDDVRALHRAVVHAALSARPEADETEAVARYVADRAEQIDRASDLLDRVEETGRMDAMSVAMRTLRDAVGVRV